jgi:hypothetical protein
MQAIQHALDHSQHKRRPGATGGDHLGGGAVVVVGEQDLLPENLVSRRRYATALVRKVTRRPGGVSPIKVTVRSGAASGAAGSGRSWPARRRGPCGHARRKDGPAAAVSWAGLK